MTEIRQPEPELVEGNDAPETGAALIAAMQASPCKDIELEPERYPMPVRDVHF